MTASPQGLARQVDGIPTVASATDRDAAYPTPSNGQKVYNVATGDLEMYDLALLAWTTIIAGIGSLSFSGTGSPEGVVAAVVGSDYRQKDGANGTVFWVKNSGAGTTGWVVMQTSLPVRNVADFGVLDPTGTVDATATIEAAKAAVLALTYPVELAFPAGRFKTSSNLVFDGAGSKSWYVTGIPGKTEIVPTNAVTIAITATNPSDGTGMGIGASMEFYGLAVDGVNNPAGIGWLIGAAGINSSNIRAKRCQSYRHSSSGGIGLVVGDVVGFDAGDFVSVSNWHNIRTLASVSNLPTLCTLRDGTFNFSYGPALDLQSGRQIVFDNCDIEGNRERGVYLHPTTIGGVNVPMSVWFLHCWYENNWNGNGAQATSYGIDLDATGTTREVDVTFRDCLHGLPGLAIQSNGLRRLTIQNFDPQKQASANLHRIGGATTIVDVIEHDKAKYNTNPLATIFAFFNGATLAANVNVEEVTAGTRTVNGALVVAAGDFTAQGTAPVFGISTNAGTSVTINAATATARTHLYKTAGVLRWQVGANGVAEGGANAGTAYTIVAYDDSGTVIDTPITILRALAGAMTVTRPITAQGLTNTFGANAGAGQAVNINGAVATARAHYFQTAGVIRWQVGADSTAEGGSDAGSAWRVVAYTDAGAVLDFPIIVTRAATGAITFGRRLVVPRIVGSGTAHVAGDYALSAGWGTSPSISAIAARDTGGRVTVTAGTGTPTANPTVTLTFKDGTWTTIPGISCSRGDVVAPIGGVWALTTPSATAPVFTFIGTPVVSNVYVLDFTVIGK